MGVDSFELFELRWHAHELELRVRAMENSIQPLLATRDEMSTVLWIGWVRDRLTKALKRPWRDGLTSASIFACGYIEELEDAVRDIKKLAEGARRELDPVPPAVERYFDGLAHHTRNRKVRTDQDPSDTWGALCEVIANIDDTSQSELRALLGAGSGLRAASSMFIHLLEEVEDVQKHFNRAIFFCRRLAGEMWLCFEDTADLRWRTWSESMTRVGSWSAVGVLKTPFSVGHALGMD